MNKDALLKQMGIHNPEQVIKLKRIIDSANHVNKYHEKQVTGFLSPDLLVYMPYIFSNYPDLQFHLEGGYEGAEYKRLAIEPAYIYDHESSVLILEMTYAAKYGEIGHRDVLGAVLGLGVKRDVIGDILVESGRVQVMTTKEMATYIMGQINKIGRMTVSSKLVELSQLITLEEACVLIHTTVKSLRLDAIVSKGFNVSRAKALALIKSDAVKLNHNIMNQAAKEIAEDALISVRGHGRIRLEGLQGLSKKEREKITIKKYI